MIKKLIIKIKNRNFMIIELMIYIKIIEKKKKNILKKIIYIYILRNLYIYIMYKIDYLK